MNRTEAWEVFDGLMLGDGNIHRCKNTAYFRMSMSKHTISIEDHFKYLEWLRDSVFAALSIKARVGLYEQVNKDQFLRGRLYKSKRYQKAWLWTECIPLLADYYDEWYTGGEWARSGRNTYIRHATLVLPKRVAESLSMPIHTLTHWFLGDGESSGDKRKGHNSTVHVRFSTNCFSREETYCLMSILSYLGIKTVKPGKTEQEKGAGLQIRLAQESIDYFMSLIEPRVMEIFGNSVSPSYKDMIKYRQRTRRQVND